MMPNDSISDEEFSDILARMETGSTRKPKKYSDKSQDQGNGSLNRGKETFREDKGPQSGWEREMETRISELDSRRGKNNTEDLDRSKRGGREINSNSVGSTTSRGDDKLKRAMDLVVDDLKKKGYTDDFISNNRETIRSKVKDYMQEDQLWF